MAPVTVPPLAPSHLLFFMGLAGAGKTFTGRLIADKFSFFAYDLDQDLTPEMRSSIERRIPFTDEMRAKYFDIVSDRISELKALHPRLIVMQAAYKAANRNRISSDHPELLFIHVTAPESIILTRLKKRGDAISSDYALTMARGFEPPRDAPELQNDTEDTGLILNRFRDLFEHS